MKVSPLEVYRDALSGIALPELNASIVEEALALSAARQAELREAMARAIGANAEDSQLYRTLEAIEAAGETQAAMVIMARELETAHHAVVEAERSLRVVLARGMAETGAPAISVGRLTASPLNGFPSVEIEEPALLPPAFWRNREPEPDRAKIRNALLCGQPVPGARLVTGRPSVRITAKES